MPLLTALLAPLLGLAAQAGAPDIAAYQAALDAHVDARSTVDYAGLEASGALEPVVASFATATEPTAAADKAAFFRYHVDHIIQSNTQRSRTLQPLRKWFKTNRFLV